MLPRTLKPGVLKASHFIVSAFSITVVTTVYAPRAIASSQTGTPVSPTAAPVSQIVKALAKFGIKVSPGVGTAITLASLPSIAASKSEAIGAVSGPRFKINLLDGTVDASTGPVNGVSGSSAAATAIGEFGIFNPVATANSTVTIGKQAWAFAKAALSADLSISGVPSAPSPAAPCDTGCELRVDLAVDIEQAFVSPGSELLIQVDDTGSDTITDGLPGGIESEIATLEDPSNPGVSVEPISPSNVWFYLRASIGSDGGLQVDSSTEGYSSPSDIITAGNFVPTVLDGVEGYSFTGSRVRSISIPGPFNTTNFSAQAATFEVPGPLPLLGVGAAFGYSRKLRKRIKASTLPELKSAID